MGAYQFEADFLCGIGKGADDMLAETCEVRHVEHDARVVDSPERTGLHFEYRLQMSGQALQRLGLGRLDMPQCARILGAWAHAVARSLRSGTARKDCSDNCVADNQ